MYDGKVTGGEGVTDPRDNRIFPPRIDLGRYSRPSTRLRPLSVVAWTHSSPCVARQPASPLISVRIVLDSKSWGSRVFRHENSGREFPSSFSLLSSIPTATTCGISLPSMRKTEGTIRGGGRLARGDPSKLLPRIFRIFGQEGRDCRKIVGGGEAAVR